MSYLDKINPNVAMEALGLRREEPSMMEIAMPVLAAFGLGLGVGAGIALLLAPKPGRELRDDLSRKALEVRDDLQKKAAELQENVKKALPKAGDLAETAANGTTTGGYRAPGRSVTEG